jgi:alanine racemase
MQGRRPTAASVDLRALAANYREVQRLARGRDVIAVVKADAYGHGSAAVGRRLIETGCTCLAVLTVEEAAVLREAELEVPILVLGGVHDAAEAEAAAALRTTPVLHDAAHATWLQRAAEQRGEAVPVQIEVDTGMRRMGVTPHAALELVERIHGDPVLRLDGIYTHLACADEPDPRPTEEQLARFRTLLGEVRARGIEPGKVHVANSAALLASPSRGEGWLVGDAVRPGLCLYGVSPAPHLTAGFLQPVMTLRTRVVTVRRLEAGDAVGYGATYRAGAPHWVATLAIGYADGVPWAAGNCAVVLAGGRRRRILGRVSMDYVTVDSGETPLEVGEEAILFGMAKGGGRLPVEEAAQAAQTIPYELLVGVGSRVPRVVVA